MSFLRVGDTFAYDPRTLHPLEDPEADERTVDEVAGFSVRLASQSGAHELEETDIRVTRAMARSLAGSNERLDHLMRYLVAARVWEPDGTGWKLVNDPNYLHLLPQEEIDRARIRGADARNPRLWALALLRDGDNCRACGRRVQWSDRKSVTGGTWQHVNIENQPTQPDEFVVYCYGCQNDPMAQLQAPPAEPYYSARTKDRIKKLLGRWPTKAEIAEYVNGQRTLPGNATAKKRAGKGSAAATGLRPDPERVSGGLRPGGEDAAVTAVAQALETPSGARDGRSTADHLIRGVTDPDPPGRVGSGSDVSGDVGSEPPSPAPPSPRKRSRRRKPKPAQEAS